MPVRRPAGHFLDLAQIQHISETAWDLAQLDRRAWGNALRVQVQIATGLRVAELHALTPRDIATTPGPDGLPVATGWLNVRRGKGNKPRRTFFVDGGPHSPTLRLLIDYTHGEGRARGNNKTTPRPCAPDSPIFTTGPRAYSHFVRNRLGPAAGLQRRVEVMNPGVPTPPNRYLVRTHLFRACFVIVARRLPRQHGRPPITWETIAHCLGHESPDMTKTRYWFADEDEMADEIMASLPAGLGVSAQTLATMRAMKVFGRPPRGL